MHTVYVARDLDFLEAATFSAVEYFCHRSEKFEASLVFLRLQSSIIHHYESIVEIFGNMPKCLRSFSGSVFKTLAYL